MQTILLLNVTIDFSVLHSGDVWGENSILIPPPHTLSLDHLLASQPACPSAVLQPVAGWLPWSEAVAEENISSSFSLPICLSTCSAVTPAWQLSRWEDGSGSHSRTLPSVPVTHPLFVAWHHFQYSFLKSVHICVQGWGFPSRSVEKCFL